MKSPNLKSVMVPAIVLMSREASGVYLRGGKNGDIDKKDRGCTSDSHKNPDCISDSDRNPCCDGEKIHGDITKSDLMNNKKSVSMSITEHVKIMLRGIYLAPICVFCFAGISLLVYSFIGSYAFLCRRVVPCCQIEPDDHQTRTRCERMRMILTCQNISCPIKRENIHYCIQIDGYKYTLCSSGVVSFYKQWMFILWLIDPKGPKRITFNCVFGSLVSSFIECVMVIASSKWCSYELLGKEGTPVLPELRDDQGHLKLCDDKGHRALPNSLDNKGHGQQNVSDLYKGTFFCDICNGHSGVWQCNGFLQWCYYNGVGIYSSCCFFLEGLIWYFDRENIV